jgi:RNA polymerase sigma-70 factor (ECF subfamily)
MLDLPGKAPPLAVGRECNDLRGAPPRKGVSVASAMSRDSDLTTSEELMSALAAGDLAAFDELVRRHEREVWRLAYRYVGDASEAEDLAQSAFLRVLRAAPRYHPTATFRTYLYQVVTRLCLDHARKHRPEYSDDLPDRPDERPAADESLVARERERRVREALDGLPGKQRIAIILRYFEGLGYGEIATALGTSTKAVERLLARGRDALYTTLRDLAL